MNTKPEWNQDFSFAYYTKLMDILANNFTCRMICEAEELLEKKFAKPVLLLRHDLDVDPARALALAEIERSRGLRATYYVMLDNPLYTLEGENLKIIEKLVSMGNHIGLHFTGNQLDERLVDEDCEKLEKITGMEIRSVSFHRPKQEWLGGNLFVGNRICVYAKPLMQWYISDSMGRFRAGEPVEAIKQMKGKILQFLTHPIWWQEKHASAVERITEWFNEKTRGWSVAEKRIFAHKVYEQIPIMPDLSPESD
ncbi:MAG: hypothetical protein ACPL1Y_03480 [Thermoplasmata archaeon]